MNLLFGIHCHQPYNNFYEIINKATDKSYLPFLKILKDFPEIKVSIHYSGWLLWWLKNYRKDFFNILRDLIETNQVEIFTSGYYEPILASIPEKDAYLQIKKSNDFLKNNFGILPKGLWLTERVWDSKIVKILVECGIKYVVVDDYHFISSGIDKEKLQGYYITEEEGYQLGIFPISKDLRYLIPFKPVEECINYIKSLNTGIIFDDGEKFGWWPFTYEWVYEKRWLINFFENLIENKIKTQFFYEYFESNKPLGRVYLPIASYFEMGEWSLNYESGVEFLKYFNKLEKDFKISKEILEKFFKGGIWKNFLVKYEESNNIHKKMVMLSKLIKNKELGDNDTETLLKAQFNDCLWHGVFGGIYLPILRNNAYIELNKLQKSLFDKKIIEDYFFDDYNYDGFGELHLINQNISAVISEKFGAQLVEFSEFKSFMNLLNTLKRRRETYHDEIIKADPVKDKDFKSNSVKTIHEIQYVVTEEIKKSLIFDDHLRYSFIDYIFDRNQNFEDYKYSRIKDIGDFRKEFKYDEENKMFSKRGNVDVLFSKFNIHFDKYYILKDNSLICDYKISNESFLYYDLFHGIELNFFVVGAHRNDSFIEINGKRYEILSDEIEMKDIKIIKISDSEINRELIITSSDYFNLWSYPVYTVSKNEREYEKTYQGTSFLLIFPLKFKAKEKIKRRIEITLK